MSQNTPIKPWYKHVWPWILMAGPIFVVIASVAMFFVAQQHATDLVTDD
ncbi:FixH family protein, partial [Klebsiella pneumoniae]